MTCGKGQGNDVFRVEAMGSLVGDWRSDDFILYVCTCNVSYPTQEILHGRQGYLDSAYLRHGPTAKKSNVEPRKKYDEGIVLESD